MYFWSSSRKHAGITGSRHGWTIHTYLCTTIYGWDVTRELRLGVHAVQVAAVFKVHRWSSSVGRPGERKLTIAKMINSDDVSME